MKQTGPDRPWLAVAAEWTSRVTTVAGQMVLPALLGLWLDQLAGTVCLFLILGGILGFAAAMGQLVQWLRSQPTAPQNDGLHHPPWNRSASAPQQANESAKEDRPK